MFARLVYHGVSQLHRAEAEVWLMPLGHLQDQWEAHKQFNGLARPKREYYYYIEDIIPDGI